MLAYYIPAKVLLGRLKLGLPESLGICIPIGIALWAWQGYVFGYLHIRWATYVYLGLFFLLWMSQSWAGNYLRRIRQTLSSIAIDRVSLLLILVGVFMQLTAVWFTGVKVAGQQYFCCGNIYDSFWFAGVTQELTNRFPPLIPGMEGEKLTGYHFWSNLAVADLVRVFHLPLFPTAFAWSGLLISLTLGLALLAFVQISKFPTAFGRWLLFFFYLGGDAVWLLLLALRNTNLFSMSSLEDGVKFLSNLPRAYAVVVFLAALDLLLLWLGKRGRRIGFLTVLALASLAGFKIYVGLFAYLGLGILALYYLWKKDTRPLFLTALTALLTLIIYLPANAGSGGLYYTGFWRFENFAVQPALGLIRLEMARQIFWEHGNWIRVLGYDYFFLALYVIAIFGTKLTGLLQTRKSLSLYSLDLHLLFLPGVVVSFIAEIFFSRRLGHPTPSISWCRCLHSVHSIPLWPPGGGQSGFPGGQRCCWPLSLLP